MAYAANGPLQVGNGLGVNLNVSGRHLAQNQPMQQPRIGGNSVRVAAANKESLSMVKGRQQAQMGQKH